MATVPDRPIFDLWPTLSGHISWADLGKFPTPIQSLAPVARALGTGREDAWVKRDDLSSPIYGGNKVRTLEVLLATAKEGGAEAIWSTGAFGSNHSVAAALHAPRVGLTPGAILFPQPLSTVARQNLEVSISACPLLVATPHWSTLPAQAALVARRPKTVVMAPGGAVPLGALGYVSAALEVARQIESGEMPAPSTVIVGVGSTCTSAGLLLGFQLAERLMPGFKAPEMLSVRVTPWPVTSPVLIARLAARAGALLASLTREPSVALPYGQLRSKLTVDGGQLGWGYGRATQAGREAIEAFRAVDGLELDTTYSSKAAAAVAARLRGVRPGPFLFWSTRSTAPLPPVDAGALKRAPWLMRTWLKWAGHKRL